MRGLGEEASREGVTEEKLWLCLEGQVVLPGINFLLIIA